MRHMKFWAILAVTALAVGAVACQPKSKLQQEVEAFNESCPLDLGYVGKIDGARCEDGNLTMTVTINEDYANMEALKDAPELMKTGVVEMCRNATGDMKALINLLEEEDAGLAIVYTGSNTGTTFSVEITCDEIKSAADSGDKDPLAVLDAQIRIANAQLPALIEEGMLMHAVVLEGDFVIYDIAVDEELYSISQFNEAKKEIQNEMKKMLYQDQAVLMYVDACQKAGKGIAYRYTGTTTGKVCLIEIPASEF